MTEKQMTERIIFLDEKLWNINNTEPLDQEARQAILDEVQEIAVRFHRSQRRRSWFFVLFLFLLFCILFVITFRILA